MSTPAEQTFPEMAWVPGGSFLMGSEDFYPEERPVHHVEVDGFWMDEHPGHRGGVPPLREGHRLRDRRRTPARPGRLSGRRSRPAGAGLAGLPQDTRPGRPQRLSQLVGIPAGRQLEAAGRAGQQPRRAGAAPGSMSPRRTSRPTRPGRAKSCRRRPSGSSPPAAASRAPSSPGATSSRRRAA